MGNNELASAGCVKEFFALFTPNFISVVWMAQALGC